MEDDDLKNEMLDEYPWLTENDFINLEYTTISLPEIFEVEEAVRRTDGDLYTRINKETISGRLQENACEFGCLMLLALGYKVLNVYTKNNILAYHLATWEDQKAIDEYEKTYNDINIRVEVIYP